MHRWQVPVTIEKSAHGRDHQTGESATHPIEPPWRTLAALLLLAGSEPASSGPSEAQGSLRLALPAHALTAHSGASNCRF